MSDAMAKTKSKPQLGELLKTAEAHAAERPKRGPAPEISVKSVSLSPAAEAVLDRLLHEVSVARGGRKTSVSAIVRALIRSVESRSNLARELAAIIESETETGEVVWGRSAAAR